MATRTISLPKTRGHARAWAPPAGWVERVALPLVGLLLVTAAVTSLGFALWRLPAAPPAAESPAPPRAVSVAIAPITLDAIDGASASAMPRSDRPVGGLVFVRCTNLWVSNADGSNAHRLLTMPGLSSPALSPDGRTVAFFGSTSGSTQLWLAAADGSAMELLGSLAQRGHPVGDEASALSWSPEGDRLGFVLRPSLSARSGRWAIWALDLEAGTFDRVGIGGPAPFWLSRQLYAADADGRVAALWGRDWAGRRLSSAGNVVSIGVAPGWWDWKKNTAILLRAADGSLELGWRPNYYRRTQIVTAPPEGHRLDPTAPPAVAAGAPVAVTLIDAAGERDIGLFDPTGERWTVLDYAWDPVWSPAPVATGQPAAEEAVRLTQSLLWSLGKERADLLLADSFSEDLTPFERPGFTIGRPERVARLGWVVPATAFGRTEEGFAAQDLRIVVAPVDGRVAATPHAAGAIQRIRTVDDAVAFLDRILTAEVVPPAGLPAGTRLAARALTAWSWRGAAEGSLNLIAPGVGRLTFNYGSAGFGCGPSPVPLTLATGTRAIVTDPAESGGYNTVAWPARRGASSGPFGISGEVPTGVLVPIAGAMDRARLTG